MMLKCSGIISWFYFESLNLFFTFNVQTYTSSFYEKGPYSFVGNGRLFACCGQIYPRAYKGCMVPEQPGKPLEELYRAIVSVAV